MRVRRVLTTRAGGASRAPYDSFNLAHGVGDDDAAVAANRARLAREAGLADRDVVWMSQIHSPTVHVVDGPQPRAVPDVDALVTARPGLALAALAADCVPVLLADPVAGVVAVAHAGRPGARNGIALRTLAAMVELGAQPGRVEAVLGPAVCGACYEVPPAMQADVEKKLPGSACRTRRGTAGLDLRAGLWRQLADAGVGRIGVDPRCTAEDRDLFSYRRDGTTGRHAAVTWLEPGDRPAAAGAGTAAVVEPSASPGPDADLEAGLVDAPAIGTPRPDAPGGSGGGDGGNGPAAGGAPRDEAR